MTIEEEIVFEDDTDVDGEPHRTRRRRPRLHLVTEPEVISSEEMNAALSSAHGRRRTDERQ